MKKKDEFIDVLKRIRDKNSDLSYGKIFYCAYVVGRLRRVIDVCLLEDKDIISILKTVEKEFDESKPVYKSKRFHTRKEEEDAFNELAKMNEKQLKDFLRSQGVPEKDLR
jgi:hypothetical protein